MASELLPCPFCGGTDIRDTGAPGHYSVACACHRGGFETCEGARTRWNTRTHPASKVSIGVEPLTGRQLHLEYTQTLGGLLTGGFGFLSPQDKAVWNYCADRINKMKA